jgi:hypothetical protein
VVQIKTDEFSGGHRALEPLVRILPTNDCHDFDRIPVDSIINTVYTAHAASVSFAVLINRFVLQRLLGKLFETIK